MIWSLTISFGSVVFPQLVSVLVDYMPYRSVTDMFGFIGITVSSVYLLVVYERGMLRRMPDEDSNL